MSHTKEALDDARWRYRYNQPPAFHGRCIACIHYDDDERLACSLLGIAVAHAERSFCPLFIDATPPPGSAGAED